MKKILHIPNYYFPHIGGIEQTAKDLISSLKDEYVEQRVICFNSEKKTVVDTVEGISVTRVGTFGKLASQSLTFKFKKELKKIIMEFNPDFVVFHYPNPLMAHYLLKYKKKVKMVLYWHLDITKQKILGKIFAGQSKKLLKWSSKVISTSQNYIDGSPFLSQFREKCVVVPSCINEERLKLNDEIINKSLQIKEENKGKCIVFTFGRHVEYKGLTYLIQASKLLDDNYKVLIGGSGKLTEELKKEASQDNKIAFLGKMSDDDLKAYFLACDIFCFPSITKNEAFGLGLAEAMYFEKPTITFTIPGSGVNFVGLNGKTCIEVENRNVNEYANAISKMASNSSFREKLGKAGKERCMNFFLFERYKKEIEKLFSTF